MKTKAFLIARVSDPEQRQALPAQVLRLEKYGKDKGYDYEMFEFDESAYKDNRKTFGNIVKSIQDYPNECIVVFDKIDRYTRDSSADEVKILNKLREDGKIEIHFPSDNLCVTKNSGAPDLFRLGIGVALARYYSDSIRDNVKRRFEQKLNDGEWPGKAPIGFVNHRISDKETTVLIDPERAGYIKKAFQLRLVGTPYRGIAAQLKADGLRNNTAKRTAIGQSYVEQILKNPFYYGVMRYNGKLYPHKYEPIISRKMFDKVQAVNEQRGTNRTKKQSIDYTFNGLLKCGSCGCSVSSYTAKGNVYMQCSKGKGPCKQIHIKEKDLVPQVAELVGKLEMNEDIINYVIDELRKHHDNQQLYYANAIEQTRSEYDTIQKKLGILYEDRLDGRITLNDYDEYVKDLKARQEQLDDQLVNLTHNDKSFLLTSSYLLEVATKAPKLFQSSKAALKSKLLRFLLSNLVIQDKKLVFNLKAPFDVISECSQNQTWLRGLDSNQQQLPPYFRLALP
jgi:site-specific DNA recombinase